MFTICYCNYYRLLSFRNQMYFKASSPDGAWSWDTFISPFSKKMWIVLVANVLMSAIVLYTTHYFRTSRHSKNKNSMENQNTKEEQQFNLANSIFTAFSAQVQQGKIFNFLLNYILFCYNFFKL